MKIKKVEDKPMVIYTKQKTKIHSHEPKNAAIKGSNIYTVNRSPKIKEVAVKKNLAKIEKEHLNLGNRRERKLTIRVQYMERIMSESMELESFARI